MNSDAQPCQLKNFVETETYRKVKDAALHAVSLQRPVLVYGKAGLGKTVSLLKIASETGARLFEVNETNKGTSAMLESFIMAFGGRPSSRTQRDLLFEGKCAARVNSYAWDFGYDGQAPPTGGAHHRFGSASLKNVTRTPDRILRTGRRIEGQPYQ